jgi:hypothetical protein
MAAEYIIYCDESVKKGAFCSNFYGGALIRSADLDRIKNAIAAKKKELNLFGEIKWRKVSPNYLDKYKDLIAYFFSFVATDQIKVRIMFTQNVHVPVGLTKEQIEDTYFILYYHFLKFAFGLTHSNKTGSPIRLRLLLDQLPDTKEKASKFKSYLLSLPKNPQFRQAKIFLTEQDIADVISHDHDILQCLDVVLGSIQFRLNNLHKAKPAGKKRRGNVTKAKHKLYQHINQLIRDIYPKFNIGITTGTAAGLSDRWTQPYRHWLFVPSQSEFDSSLTKKK